MATVQYSMTVSPALNARLEQWAAAGHCTKGEVLRKAIALYEVAVDAQSHQQRLGIVDQNRQVLAEIVGL